MTGISLAYLHVLLALGGSPTYTEVRQESLDSGQPFVVLIGADWCPHCRVMKQRVVPQLKENGSFDKVSFAIVDSDREPGLAAKLMRGSSIPQLVMFTKNADGKSWHRRYLNGSQSPEAVTTFIRQGARTSVSNAEVKSNSSR